MFAEELNELKKKGRSTNKLLIFSSFTNHHWSYVERVPGSLGAEGMVRSERVLASLGGHCDEIEGRIQHQSPACRMAMQYGVK